MSDLCSRLRDPRQQDLVGKNNSTQQEPPPRHLGGHSQPAPYPVQTESTARNSAMVNPCPDHTKKISSYRLMVPFRSLTVSFSVDIDISIACPVRVRVCCINVEVSSPPPPTPVPPVSFKDT